MMSETIDSSLASYLNKWLKEEETNYPFRFEQPRPELLFEAYNEGLADGLIGITVDKKTPNRVDMGLLLKFDSDYYKSYLLVKGGIRRQMEKEIHSMVKHNGLVVILYPDAKHPKTAVIKRSLDGSKMIKRSIFATIDTLITVSKDWKKILSVFVVKE